MINNKKIEYIPGEPMHVFLKRLKEFKLKYCQNNSNHILDMTTDLQDNDTINEQQFYYIDGENTTNFMRRASEFRTSLQEKEYDTILNFLNDIMDNDKNYCLKSLRDFKKIHHDDLFFDPDNNKEIILKYKNKISKLFNLDITQTKINKMKDNYLIYIIRRMLNKVNYKLYTRRYKSGIYYYIKAKSNT